MEMCEGWGWGTKTKANGFGDRKSRFEPQPFFHFKLCNFGKIPNLLELQFPPQLSRSIFLTEFSLQLNQMTQVNVPGTQ